MYTPLPPPSKIISLHMGLLKDAEINIAIIHRENLKGTFNANKCETN